MEAIRQYAFSLIGGAMVCGVLTSIAPKGANQQILKLLSGLFLTVTLLYPIANRDWRDMWGELDLFSEADALEAAAVGENYTRNLLAVRIKQDTEEYILDKAAAMDVLMSVNVTVSDEDIPVPMTVEMIGEVSEIAKQRLEDMIQKDLGIAKENQLWTEARSGKN